MMDERGSRTTDRPPFGTVLVANRGEIACRIIATLRRLRITSVAVFSDADAGAPHVGMADRAVRIGPAPARDSYLNEDALIGAALAQRADAIHPGYGFLSENAAFAAACAEAGIVFVGPGERALAVMGEKIAAKRHVAAAGVPTIPGIAEPGLSDDELIAAAPEVGYPLLVKPSAGGGGKGMEIARSAADLPEALQAARRIAASAFGDDTLFLERLVSKPRHIEVQVLADRHGNVVHLGERECSLQRRHQKVMEEAPSPLLDDATRGRIGEAACEVARSVDYQGAGTVEFLVSDDAPDEFFFMEMNTRLQVEHPVTELVTGLDLVEWQLRIAAGESLTFEQADVRLDGHAVEARIYAEDPARGFLPGGGRVLGLRMPAGEGVRVDSGLAPGLDVASDYDPMLAKVIAWAPDRTSALDRLDSALADTSVLGLTTNIGWLRDLLADEDVRAGRLDTTLIDTRFAGPADTVDHSTERVLVALVAHRQRLLRAASSGSPLWAAPSGWRIGGPQPVRYDVEGRGIGVLADLAGLAAGAARVWIAGEDEPGEHRAGVRLEPPAEPGAPIRARLSWDGVVTTYDLAAPEPGGGSASSTWWVGQDGVAADFTVRGRVEHKRAERAAAGAGDPDVRSPMPGTVVAVTVAEQVAAGDVLVVVEAMKMEHRLVASTSGVVSVAVAVGDLVKRDQIVARVEQHNPDEPHPDEPNPDEGVS